MKPRTRMAVLAAALGSVLVFPQAASAETVVPQGRSVVEVTTIGQDVTLNGTSKGSVIVVDGDLHIGPHGRALDGITLIGGHLSTAPGADVRGDVLQVGGSVPRPGGWSVLGVLAALLVIRSAVVWLVIRIGRVLAEWPTTPVMLAAARTRPLRATLVGALVAAGLIAAAILLTLTVVGIVFAAALLGVLLLASALGIGFTLNSVRSRDHARTIAVALCFPLIGDALLALAAIVALGAAFHYLVDGRRSQATPPIAQT